MSGGAQSGTRTPSGIAVDPVRAVRIDRRLRAHDFLAVLYLGITIPLLVAHPVRSAGLPLAALHLAGIAILAGGRWLRLHRHPVGRFVLNFYPVALFGLLYTEVGFLNRVFYTDVFFDPGILSLEELIFRSQPSRDLRGVIPGRPFGEYLHLGYVSYYLLVPVLAGLTCFRCNPMDFEKSISCVSLVFYLCFLTFILYPVAGPYYEFTQPPMESVGYLLPHFTRWVLDRGSSVGAAFPSSHVAVATTVWIMAMRYQKKLAVVLTFFVPALALGAVYLGFHYAIDIVAGAILGVLVGTVGHAFVTRLVVRLRELPPEQQLTPGR